MNICAGDAHLIRHPKEVCVCVDDIINIYIYVIFVVVRPFSKLTLYWNMVETYAYYAAERFQTLNGHNWWETYISVLVVGHEILMRAMFFCVPKLFFFSSSLAGTVNALFV